MATAQEAVARQQAALAARRASAHEIRRGPGPWLTEQQQRPPFERQVESTYAETMALRNAGQLTRTTLTEAGWVTKRA